MPPATAQDIARHNVRLFIAFRTLFNARFYYPIFAILFLDFGLTIEQFSLLNVIWAITIILAEVPSGALSDLFGRKKLLLLTSLLMVAEMAVWAFTPTGNPQLLFWLLACNRILSGLGEASASGSDEALVFDSLEQAGMKDQWSTVLARTQRFQSFGFMFAMIVGGVIYDIDAVQKAADFFGLSAEISRETILRWPLYLTLLSSLVVLAIATRFIEPQGDKEGESNPRVLEAFRQTWEAGKWIASTPFALIVIVAGANVDSVIRMFITLSTEYYRLIEFSPIYFGFIGAAISALSIFTAGLGKWLVDHRSPTFIFFLVIATSLLGFTGASFFIPYWGLVFVVTLYIGFSVTAFSVSFFLNNTTDKSMRATVLSFKGMAFNLGYGLIGWLYAMLGYYLREDPTLASNEDAHFIAGLGYFPGYFLVASVLVIAFALWRCPRPNSEYQRSQEKA